MTSENAALDNEFMFNYLFQVLTEFHKSTSTLPLSSFRSSWFCTDCQLIYGIQKRVCHVIFRNNSVITSKQLRHGIHFIESFGSLNKSNLNQQHAPRWLCGEGTTLARLTIRADFEKAILTDEYFDETSGFWNNMTKQFRYDTCLDVVTGVNHSHLGRRRKDPNKPRGYISAFNYFAKSFRNGLGDQNPGLDIRSPEQNNRLNRITGRRWKLLLSSEREYYDIAAVRDKIRYLKEMKAYQPPVGHSKCLPRINPPSGIDWDGTVVNSSGDATVVNTTGRPRPISEYTVFVQQEIMDIGVKCANLSNHSRYFGMRWKSMTQDEHRLYEYLADKMNKRHM
eukprot:CAMPEP_0197288952 /NCGR_PEP_ID=MMETSP0890-20130614/6167_1 /TAXON_ID=44058 ORGANISM="Aureoumbra lagunensis, Strain CCMP1510" /NCGR_SAMPLE_ID=MMETSP0890 /ASSEMBLY_ACC=CAM_ASM_000533 /LENGTH=337 /DNA_ID=CAMNT_0042760057 /DNA_START=364 /DNA_END=1377 /DNA_ORIENTATION=+